MNVWQETILNAVYTLSPTHCGAAQAEGAVDLPIQREAHTGFPLLPASALKGVARARVEAVLKDKRHKDLFDLFGPEDSGSSAELAAAGLAWTDGRLVAYPARALSRPFLHVTCAAVLGGLARDLRLLGLGSFLPEGWKVPQPGKRALVADAALGGQPLLIEDLVYGKEEVARDASTAALAEGLARLLPEPEQDSRDRLRTGLVVVPDEDFTSLMGRVPVRARIKLNEKKTTGQGEESGNLWYEEFLPPECFFVSIIGARKPDMMKRFDEYRAALRVVQIGGNETVGQGLCCQTFWSAPEHGGGR